MVDSGKIAENLGKASARVVMPVAIGLTAWAILSPAESFGNKPVFVGFLVAITAYLVKRWAEKRFGKN